MSAVAVNVRGLAIPMTGVQRYTLEIVSRLGERVDTIAPRRPMIGMRGHLWEQTTLARRAGGRLLWSPGNVGPLAYSKQVLTVHDAQPLDHPEWYSKAFARWYGFLIPRLIHRVRAVITVSEFTRQRLIARTSVAPEKITVVHCGVGPEFLAATRSNRSLESLGLSGVTYFLVVGSVVPRKNHERVIAAWRRVLGELPPHMELVVAGEVGRTGIYSSVSLPDADRIRFVGRVPDALLPSLYASALGYIHASIYEGFGLPIIEAMASGTPTIVSNTTTGPEVAGDAGLMIDPLDVDDIARAILTLARNHDLQGRLRSAGQKRAKRFTWEDAADAVWSVLAAQSHPAGNM